LKFVFGHYWSNLTTQSIIAIVKVDAATAHKKAIAAHKVCFIAVKQRFEVLLMNIQVSPSCVGTIEYSITTKNQCQALF
jgi:hypothetical protein